MKPGHSARAYGGCEHYWEAGIKGRAGVPGPTVGVQTAAFPRKDRAGFHTAPWMAHHAGIIPLLKRDSEGVSQGFPSFIILGFLIRLIRVTIKQDGIYNKANTLFYS